jgi:membrane associated rhomboid family serine protease
MAYQAPIRSIAAPGFFGELSAWLVAVVFVGAFAALGLSNFGIAAVLGAIAGVLLFLKMARDTEENPTKAFYFCSSCKRYFEAGTIEAKSEKATS